MNALGHPILSCDEARLLETGLFHGDETKEWEAMQRAGRALATAVLRDFGEIGGFPPDGRVLVLAGKGHNGGDALIAARVILEKFPAARPEVFFVFGDRTLRPLALRAWRELVHAAGEHASGAHGDRTGVRKCADLPEKHYDLCLDGVFGFKFRPPADLPVARLFERVNALQIRLRAAIDLPSAGLFRADFTYATGSVKAPVLDAPEAGRVRYLDLGFFPSLAGVADLGPESTSPAANRVLNSAILSPLAGLRDPRSDKRAHGHVMVLGGSRSYPGAIMMTVLAALRSGVGLVTAFVPESLGSAYAAHAPEAMWVGWPETAAGGLALEGQHLLRARLERATALVIGPGLGRETETLALVADIVKTSPVPVLLDADALQPDIVRAAQCALVLTPHAGEFERIATGADLRAFCADLRATVALKGPVTRVCDGGAVHHSFFGGPVLARGGSGDLLAGLTGGLLAQTPQEPLLAACRGVVWHGLAADLLARAHGQTAVRITQLLDFLPAALRHSAHVP